MPHHLGSGEAGTKQGATDILAPFLTVASFRFGYGKSKPHVTANVSEDNHGKGKVDVKEQIVEGRKEEVRRRGVSIVLELGFLFPHQEDLGRLIAVPYLLRPLYGKL